MIRGPDEPTEARLPLTGNDAHGVDPIAFNSQVPAVELGLATSRVQALRRDPAQAAPRACSRVRSVGLEYRQLRSDETESTLARTVTQL
jgi:hypothetical protein